MDAIVKSRPEGAPDTTAQAKGTPGALTAEELRLIHAYWRAANYVSVGQIYLYDNPLLREPLTLAHVKPLVVSHWGTTPGQNFIYAHLNRVIKKHDLDMIYVAGPGHGNADVRRGQRRSIVQAVPRHSRFASFRAKLLQQFHFLSREQPCFQMRDPQLLGNQLRRPLAIAGKYPLVRQAKCTQRGEGLAASFAQVIAKENRAPKHSRIGHQHWRGSLFIGVADKRLDPGDAILPQELRIAGENLTPIQIAKCAPAGNDFSVLRSGRSNVPPRSLGHNGSRKRM